MKIKVKNLGVLKQAEFSLGDITIICGENNTGKTYATYALFGFLSLWRETFVVNIPDQQIEQLLNRGVLQIDILDYFDKVPDILREGCEKYVKLLPTVFASSVDRFNQTEFIVDINIQDNKLDQGYKQSFRSFQHNQLFSINKNENSKKMTVTLFSEGEQSQIPPENIQKIISDALNVIIFYQFFPNAFIASSERTGGSIFRQELPLEQFFLGREMYDSYPLPIKNNVKFIKNLETIVNSKSFIAEEYPELLEYFADIIGGDYTFTENDQLYYMPKGKKFRLSMDESSSAVRALMIIGFYLKHVAQKGDLLIIDEPELNLHPENQRRVARLLARLVNIGIKIFITTHSDYLIKELNTLIMLNQDKPYLQRIAKQENYKNNELLIANQVKVYIAEEALVQLEGHKRRTRCQTLTSANVTQDLGIEISSFDTAIETMNRIQEAIIWGE